MPSNPLTRQLIPSWLIFTVALLVFAMLFVATQGGINAERLGLGQVSVTETKTTHTISKPDEDKQRDVVQKEVEDTRTTQRPTLWDGLSLVFVPLAGGLIIAIAGHTFNKRQREREETIQSLRAQDETLQKYLDQMSDLLVNRELRSEPQGLQKYRDKVNKYLVNLGLRTKPEDPEPNGHVRDLAKARTIAVLLSLDGEHKRRPLKLVHELGLIGNGNPVLELKNAGLDGANLSELTLHNAYLECADLRVANLTGADLQGSDLSSADLRGATLWRTDLKNADLEEANLLPYDEKEPERLSSHNLRKIDLRKERVRPRRLTLARALKLGLISHTFHKLRWRAGRPIISKLTVTNLRGAILTSVCLREALLSGADLTRANLTDADLTHAVLTNADLTRADLTRADLRGADLTGANLSQAEGVTDEQLDTCESLEGATMPNGQKYRN